jgi:hypothetical protein
MKKILNEGNQIHNYISSSGSGTVIKYGSGSDFLTSYGSGSTSQKVAVPTVPVPVPQRCLKIMLLCAGSLVWGICGRMEALTLLLVTILLICLLFYLFISCIDFHKTHKQATNICCTSYYVVDVYWIFFFQFETCISRRQVLLYCSTSKVGKGKE